MILRPLILIICLLCPLTDAARADDRLDEAIAAYLADDDAAALPVLAELAAGGDAKARLLLGRIATRPFSPWVAALKRKDRNALLRAPGGLSGKSWLAIASDAGDPAAAAFEAVSAPPYDANSVRRLLSLGEEDAAATTLVRSVNHGAVDGLGRLIEDGVVPADMAYAAAWSLLTFPPADFRMTKEFEGRFLRIGFGLAVLGAYAPRFVNGSTEFRAAAAWIGGYGKPTVFDGRDAAASLLSEAPDTDRPVRRLRRYCEAACPEEASQCMADAVFLAGGYNRLWEAGSPVESVIGDETFLASRRFNADFARRLKIAMGAWPKEAQSAWTSRSCAAASRFRTRFD